MSNALVHDRVRLWLKNHAAAERSFAKALQRYFTEQAERIAEAVETFQSSEPKSASKRRFGWQKSKTAIQVASANFQKTISPGQVPLIFNVVQEHERMQKLVRRNLGAIMSHGAREELQAAKDAVKATDPTEEIIWQGLPANVRQAILRALDESAEQDYWLNIQSETETNLIDIIKAGLAEGHNAYKISMAIREHLGGYEARRRALKIARTETTGAYNAGHVEAMRSLGSAVEGKKWISIGDKDTRESHEQANGQTVRGVDQPFVIGGFETPYPGHFSLPASERVFCRCTVISVLNEGILAAADNPEFDQ